MPGRSKKDSIQHVGEDIQIFWCAVGSLKKALELQIISKITKK